MMAYRTKPVDLEWPLSSVVGRVGRGGVGVEGISGCEGGRGRRVKKVKRDRMPEALRTVETGSVFYDYDDILKHKNILGIEIIHYYWK